MESKCLYGIYVISFILVVLFLLPIPSFSTDLLSIDKITPYNTYLNISGNLYVSSTRVGIGTSSPSSKLHVVGGAIITNGLTVSGGTVSLPNGQINNAEISEMDWTKLQNYPTGCGAGKAIQAVGDTLTCIDVNPTNGITGSGTANRIAKFTGSNTIGNSGISDSSDAVAITIDSSERVGIGTTSHGAKLEVKGNIAASGSHFIIDRPDTTGGWARGIMYYPTGNFSGTELAGIGLLGSGTSVTRIYLAHGNDPWSSTAGVHILTNGNVGIGTTNPSGKLEVSSGTSGDSLIYIVADTDNNNEEDNPGIIMRQDGGLGGAYLGMNLGNVADNDFVIGIRYSNTDYDVLTIKSDTSVGIGTTSPGDKLDINGNVRIRDGLIKDNSGDTKIDFSDDASTAQIVFSGSNLVIKI